MILNVKYRHYRLEQAFQGIHIQIYTYKLQDNKFNCVLPHTCKALVATY